MARHVPALAWLPGYQAQWLPRVRGMFDLSALARFRRLRPVEFRLALLALFGVLVARVEGGLWYADAEFVADRLADLAEGCDPPCRVVILDLEETPELDITSLERLRQLAEHQHRAGRTLLLARVHGQVIDQLRAEGGLLDAIDGMFPTIEAAMDQAARDL